VAVTGVDVDRFIDDGYVHLPGALPRELADRCRALLWEQIGLDASDPTTWTRPVLHAPTRGAAFDEAANTARLHAAFNAVVGVGRWLPRGDIGNCVIRFPHPDDSRDTGWHVDASYLPEGEQTYRVNVWSRDRALLLLFLLSDVGSDDAPTRIKVGSHLDVPPFLTAAGERGLTIDELAQAMDAAGMLDRPERPLALATGEAGDVYLCHPFLLHAAQRHRGTVPRFLTQPGLWPAGPLLLDRPDGRYSPVEEAIRRGLQTSSRS
jgi:hypothetical protein